MAPVHSQTQLLVVGGGPGGYVAAIRAAQLGIKTTLVEGAARGQGLVVDPDALDWIVERIGGDRGQTRSEIGLTASSSMTTIVSRMSDRVGAMAKRSTSPGHGAE